MTAKEVIQLIGLVTCSITTLIIFFGLVRSPFEIWQSLAGLIKSIRIKRKKKTTDGQHRVVSGTDGPDSSDDPQVAADQGDDGARSDDEKEAA